MPGLGLGGPLPEGDEQHHRPAAQCGQADGEAQQPGSVGGVHLGTKENTSCQRQCRHGKRDPLVSVSPLLKLGCPLVSIPSVHIVKSFLYKEYSMFSTP